MKHFIFALLASSFIAVLGVPVFGDAIATYTVVGPQYDYSTYPPIVTNTPFINDAHAAVPNDVAPTQSLDDVLLAPATDLVAAPANGNYGMGPGYPFGYTVSAQTYAFPTTLATAESQGTFLTFTINPELGSTVDLSDIDLTGASFNSDFAGQATNANQSGDLSTGYILSLTSSLDNYSTSLGDLPFNFTTAGNDITLPPSAFQDLTAPVTFHLDLYAVASPDEALFVYLTLTDGSVINVNGSATAVPEPGTWALLAAGSCGLLIVRRKRSAALPC